MTPKTPIPSLTDVHDLDTTHIPQILVLQAHIIETLPEDQKNAIVPKTALAFKQRLTYLGKMMGISAITETGALRLIAYATFALPNALWPVADMLFDPKALPCASHDLAVLQNDVVHKNYQNNHLHHDLIKARLELCKPYKRPHVMAEVAAFNPKSLKGFLDYGFTVIHAAVDPSDGCKLIFPHKNVAAKNGPWDHKHGVYIDPVTQFESLFPLFAKGYQGISIKRTNDTNGYLLFMCPKLGA